MGAETEWWEDAAPEIDFMPESDAAPRKGIRVRVSVCVCERVQCEYQGVHNSKMRASERERQTERGRESERWKKEGPTCIKQPNLHVKKRGTVLLLLLVVTL